MDFNVDNDSIKFDAFELTKTISDRLKEFSQKIDTINFSDHESKLKEEFKKLKIYCCSDLKLNCSKLNFKICVPNYYDSIQNIIYYTGEWDSISNARLIDYLFKSLKISENQISKDEFISILLIKIPSEVEPISTTSKISLIKNRIIENELNEEFPIEKPFIPETEAIFSDSNQVSIKKYLGEEKLSQSFNEIIRQETREEIGFWSEKFVNEYLTKNKKCYSYILWANQNGETFESYDFRVIENGIEKFIDVKGTTSANKNIVFLSAKEWAFMFNKEENYIIYRVFNAGKLDCRIEIIENPSRLLREGKILPNPIQLQI